MLRSTYIACGAAIAILMATSNPSLAQHTGHPAPPDTSKRAPARTPPPRKATPAREPAARPAPAQKPATPAVPARTRAATPRTQPAKPQPAATVADSARADSAHRAMMHRDTTHRDTTHRDTTHRDTTHRDTTHLNTMRSDTMHRDTTHRDSTHRGMVQGDTTSSDTSHTMMMAGPLGISMDRMGSGTTWIPDAVTLPSVHLMARGWAVMLHGFAFAQYTKTGGPRGDSQFGSVNWAMLMASRALAGGMLTFRVMPSLDPATVGRCGYPLLLQSGETCHGAPLVDRQHPHEFWMELGAIYEREISDGLALSLYAAPSGEPALGPVAFMHRPSAMDNPVAPLGHHWQDATHTSFGVLTAGIFSRTWKLEGSWFNGREPDESRWNIDRIRLDSYSTRVTLNPSANWSFTGAYGYLKSPESLHPEMSVRRITASALHGVRAGADGQWATTFIFGANKHQVRPGAATFPDPHASGEEQPWTTSFLVESELVHDSRNTVFARAEMVTKTGDELQIPGFNDADRFLIRTLNLGYVRELARSGGLTIGLGTRATVNFAPAAMELRYGSKRPLGGVVFLRVRPAHPTPEADPHAGMPMGLEPQDVPQ